MGHFFDSANEPILEGQALGFIKTKITSSPVMLAYCQLWIQCQSCRKSSDFHV